MKDSSIPATNMIRITIHLTRYMRSAFLRLFLFLVPAGLHRSGIHLAQYDGAIAYMDACIQQLFNKLEELDIADNTIVVLTSDHGGRLRS